MKPKKLAAKQPAEPGNSAKTEAAKLSRDAGEGGKATALELAMLAAMIDPAACREGNHEAALFRAFTLLEESMFFWKEWMPMSMAARVSKLGILALEYNEGAAHLFNSIVRREEKRPVPLLTLAMKDREDDTIRPYLAKHFNLEGKNNPARNPWAQVRTVRESLLKWFIDLANEANRRNATRIQVREARDEADAAAKGLTVEQFHRQGRAYLHNEVWNDGEADFNELLSQCAVADERPPNRIIRYDIPTRIVDEMIAWRRELRQRKDGKGGFKKLKQLTREEIFGTAVK